MNVQLPHPPKVSFLVPAYVPHVGGIGDLRNLGRCLDSIEAQTDPAWEVVLVHDGEMPDAVYRVARKMRERTGRVTFFHVPYRGIRGGHHSVEAGKYRAHASSEYLYILNGDNVVRPDFVEKMFDPEADIVTCYVKMNDLPGRILDGHAIQRGAIDRANYMVRTDIARRVSHKMHLDSDYDFVADCYQFISETRPVRLKHVDEVLAEHN